MIVLQSTLGILVALGFRSFSKIKKNLLEIKMFYKYLKGLIGARQSTGYGDVAMNIRHNLYSYRRSTVMWGNR